MPDTIDTKVPGQQPAPAASPAPSPAPGSDSTPVESPPKVEPTDAELKFQEYEQRMAKYEQDISNLKSASQKRENQLAQQASQRERELQAELERVRVADMDEDERKIYDSEQAIIHSQEMAEQLQSLQREKADMEAFNQAYDWFLKADVPAKDLVTDQGYDALFQSGWNYINNERQALKKGFIAKPSPTPNGEEPPKAPTVVTTTAAVPGTGPSWDDLIAKYGSREEVYRRVETQQLPPDIIPRKKTS